LAAYISFDALDTLITHEPPHVSYFGIVYAAACIVVMPLLARAKRRVAVHPNSDALHADSHQSDICAYLSVILLVGLGLNALFGWWWADPVAALHMLPIIIKEGFAALRGESCSYHHRCLDLRSEPSRQINIPPVIASTSSPTHSAFCRLQTRGAKFA
jgi:divalent metal cation (Fe/Co/Zn/Cd) transporter